MIGYTRIIVIIPAYDVHVLIAGIPVERIACLVGGPHPDQIVETVVHGKSLEHEAVKGFAGAWALVAPPEPFAGSFMKRPQ